MSKKTKETIRIQEAMDNLTALAALEPGDLTPIGIVHGTKVVTEGAELPKKGAVWLSAEGSEAILEVLDLSYEALLAHLETLALQSGGKEEAGIAALMTLAAEAAEKLEPYLLLRLEKPLAKPIQHRSSFIALQGFYRSYKEKMEEESTLEEQEEKALEEALKGDRDYELFSLSTEEGEPYYDPSKLQKIRLTVHFETDGESFEEDPLLQVRAMLDRDLHATARQILDQCFPYLRDFFHAHRKFPDQDLAQALSMAILSLFLASDGRHLIQNTAQKSCLLYFKDFHRFLRRALKTDSYQKWIAYPPEKSETEAHLFLFLAHLLSRAFFTRPGGVKQELIGLIHRSARRGEEIERKKGIRHSRQEENWARLASEDASLRALLARFPDGPLFKILDVIREQKESGSEMVFDPIAQENFPAKLYDFRMGKKSVHVLRVPSPTRQALVQKAFIVDEFRGFLRSLCEKKQKHLYLLVNLQDDQKETSYPRVKEIEALAKSAEFRDQIAVLSLPQNTPFYLQTGPHLNRGEASSFLKKFLEEIESSDSGYRFPLRWKTEERKAFIHKLLGKVHQEFFGGKKELSRKERQDCIEIVHQFLVWETVKELDADFLSFTCKDGVDAGAAFSASFFVFTKTQSGEKFGTKEEMDHLRWLLYFPALLVRERVIDSERFFRTLSCLELLA